MSGTSSKIAPAPRITKPLLWSVTSSFGIQALSFVTFAVLARILGAPAFGLVALAALVIDLFLVVSNAGISEAVVQRRTLTEEDADTAFWANLACGSVFCAGTLAVAPLLASMFGQPALTPVIRALSAIFVITPLGAIHTARLTRELQFQSVALRNVAAALLGAGIGLPLALLGFGVWALVGQRIAQALAMVLCAWLAARWMPGLGFRWATCRQMVRFGGLIALSGTLNQINIRSAEIISGALVGPVAVAFIRAGSRIVEVLNQVTYMPFQQIAMPVLARTNHDHALLAATYLRLSRLSAFVMFPAFLGCFTLAPEIVAIVFGPGWEPVTDALRIFACAVVASQINNLIVAAMTSVGESQAVLSWTTTQIVLGTAVAVAVHQWGWQAMLMTGVARGYVILPYGFYLLRKHTGLRLTDVLRSLRPALTSAALMTCAVLTGKRAFDGLASDLVVIGICLPAGVVIYLTAYVWQDRQVIEQLRELLSSRLQRRQVAGSSA